MSGTGTSSAGTVTEGPPRTPRDGRAPRAGRSGRSPAGSGCRRGRTCEPGSRSTPSAWTRSAAQSSIRTPGTVSRGNPIEPARGRTHSNRSAQSSKNASRRSRFAATIAARTGQDAVAGTQRDDGQDLGRRRRADRRVVLVRGDPGEQVAVVRRQPADAQAGHRVRLRHDAERDPARQGVGAGRQPVGLVELEAAVDLVDEEMRAALGGDRHQRVPGRPVGQHPGRVVRGVDDDEPGRRRDLARGAGRGRSPSRAASCSSCSVTSAPAARATSYRLW